MISESKTVETYSEADIADTYILSLQSSLQSQIEELGYDIDNIEIGVTSDYSDISYINIKMKNNEYDESKIFTLITENLEIDTDKIYIYTN